MDSYCSKCSGASTLVVGLIFLANYWFLNWDWWLVIGLLLVIGGIIHIAKPSCGCDSGCCAAEMEKPAAKKRK